MRKERKGLQRFAVVLAAALVLGLAGCGGGSNVKMTPSTPPPPSPPPGSDGDHEPQPATDAHLVLVHAEQAHDEGYTGRNVVIGVVDTGINRQHPALKGRILKELVYVSSPPNNLNKDDVVGHGTMVSEIAAGKPFDDWPGGIAPDADLVSARIIADKEPDDDGSGHGNQVEASDAAGFGQTLNPDLIDAGVQIMNNSWGGLYFDPAHPAQVADAFADAYRPFVVDHDGLVVFAAGNSSFDDPSDLASLPHWAPDLERGWLVAVALDTQNPDQLADYSNQCGRAMDYCLTAPGNVVVPGAHEDDDGWNLYVAEGTSFAAPEVSGAAAVVWQAFPYFDNDLVRQTLLGTAQPLGDTQPNPTFGYGLLDVGKAVHGPAQFNWGDVTVRFDDISSTWSNDIRGDGGLIKQGSGTLVLSGKDTYAGGTRVDGGFLQATHTLPGDVRVGGAGTLDAVPGIAGDLDNTGTVALHDGDTEVGGHYHQAATATLAVSLGSKLTVDGKATLDGGTLEVTGADDGYVASKHTNVLTADHGVEGTFDRLHKDQGVVFTATTIEYDADHVWLDTTGLDVTTAAKGQGVSYTPASFGSAQRVQGAFTQLDRQLVSGHTAHVSPDFLKQAGAFQHAPDLRAAQASLRSLSGQLHASSAAMTLHAIDATGAALSHRLQRRADQGDLPETGAWSSSLRRGGDMSRAGYDRVDFQWNGWLMGQDVRFGRHGVAGFAFSQGRGVERLNSRLDRNRGRNVGTMVYAGRLGRRWYAHGRMGLGHFHQSMGRMLLLGRQREGVRTDYHGRYRLAAGETGLHLAMGQARLTPFVRLQYARVTRNAFAEQGAGGFGLKAGAQTLQRWQGGLGLRLSRGWHFSGGRSVHIAARAQWRDTLAETGAVFDASFVGLQHWQPLTGVGLSRHRTMLGVALRAQPSRHSRVRLACDYLRGNRGHVAVASANFTLSF